MLPALSRWVREGPAASILPWRVRPALERWTVGHGYGGRSDPIGLTLGPDPAAAWLIFGGDVAMHRWQQAPGGHHPLRGLVGAMQSADVRVINLETQLTSRLTPAGVIGSSLRADPAAINILAELGIDAVNCANNHCLDFGPDGLSESVTALRSSGIAAIGMTGPDHSGRVVVDARGIRIGLLGFTDDWRYSGPMPTSAYPWAHDEAMVRSEIAAMKPLCDVLVVQLHWGYEWSMYPMRTQRDLARSYVTAGANLVICHHAHVPMGVEAWGDGLIAHGLGNLYFGPPSREAHPFATASFLLRVGVTKTAVVCAGIIPVRTDAAGSVAVATGTAADKIHGAIRYLSSRLEGESADGVEAWHVANAGCHLLLDFARRISAGDARGVSERLSGLEPPRQRWMIGRLKDSGGVTQQIGSLLEVLRLETGGKVPSSLVPEIERLAPVAQQWVGRHPQIGRIP